MTFTSRGAGLLLAALALALTGCIRVELAVTVHDDGSGVIGALLAVDDAILALAGESPDELFGELETLPGAAVDEYRQDGFVGQRVSIPVPDMALAGDYLGAFGDEVDAGDLSVERDGEGWLFSLVVPPMDAGDDEFADLAALITEDASYTVRVSLPGEVAEHNADRIEGGALVWEMDFAATEPRTLHARSQPGGGQDRLLAVLVGAGVLAVIVAGVARARAKRQSVT